MKYNLAWLERQKNLVTMLSAKHNFVAAAKRMEEEVKSLSAYFYFGIGSCLMIISNLLTNFGLVNRVIGTLHSIVWQSDNDLSITLPYMLLFILNQYLEEGSCNAKFT